MAKILPPEDIITQEPIHDYWVELSGVLYRLRIHYKERQDSWYLDIRDADDAALVLGRRISTDNAILAKYRVEGLPPGLLILMDTTGARSECTYEDLGRSHLLAYLEPEEIPAPAAAEGVTVEISP